MIQLYALMRQQPSDALNERFPDAVAIGPYRLGVFIDSELDVVTALTDCWQHFTSEAEFNSNVAILNYEQAKDVSSRYVEGVG